MKAVFLAFSMLLAPAVVAATAQDDVKALRKEIAAIQVDRALNLSRDQARALAPLLKEAVGIKNRLKSEHDRNAPALVAALTRARDELRRSGAVSEPTRQAVRDARGDNRLAAEKDKLKDLKHRAMSVITPDQRRALADVQLDLAPRHDGDGPRHGKNPFKREVLRKVIFSDAFVALVDARAR